MAEYVAELQPPHDEPGPTDFLGIYKADTTKDAESKVKEDWGLDDGGYDGYTLRVIKMYNARGRLVQRTVDLHDCKDNLTQTGAGHFESNTFSGAEDALKIPHRCTKCGNEFTMVFRHEDTVRQE